MALMSLNTPAIHINKNKITLLTGLNWIEKVMTDVINSKLYKD